METTPLVNAHTHLELGWASTLRPFPPGQPFPDWMGRLVRAWDELSTSQDYTARIQRSVCSGIATLQAAGVTHIGDITNTGLSIEPLLDSGLAGVVYLEVNGTDFERGMASFERARMLLQRYRPQERNGLRLGLTPHTPYTVHPDVLRAVTHFCLAEDVPMSIHVAESPFEPQALQSGMGPLVTLAAELGLPPPPKPGLSPITYLESLGVLAARPLLVHMVHVSDDDLDIVARYGAKIAHCPRSNLLLQCGRMPLEKMLARDIPVAFGTDSLGSSTSLNVREEAAAGTLLHENHVGAAAIRGMLANTSVLG